MYFFLHVCLHICIHIVFFQVDLRHLQENKTADGIIVPEVDLGIDLTEFYMSVEWDILEVLHYLLSPAGIRDFRANKNFRANNFFETKRKRCQILWKKICDKLA